MFVHRSNRLPILVDGLGRLVSSPGLGAIEREQILIQSAGMQRYLAQELTSRLGVTFGLEFPYPRAFVQRIVDKVLGPSVQQALYERESLTFRIYGELPKLGHPEVERFLASDRDGDDRLELAQKLANLFDQYIVYRPRLLESWEAATEPSHDFQAVLWKRLQAELGPYHFASRVRTLLRASDDELRSALPKRLSLVGGAGLPPLFLSILSRFGEVTDVHLFSFAVSSEYFADAHPLEGDFPELGSGVHSLLMKMGKVGGDYQALLEAVGYQDGGQNFVLPEGGSLLHALKRDILECKVRGLDELLPGAMLSDRSIQVIAAHSPLREVEVLRENLLLLFEQDPSLRAEDVAVLVTDMGQYAPMIRAVFGSTAAENAGLPFRVSDENERAVSAAADALLRALELLRGRFKARSVLDLLQTEPVRRKFEIDSDEFEKIVTWVVGANIRWGLDPAQRASYGLLGFELNTWEFGIRRLLLGLATGGGEPAFNSTVPFGDIEFEDAVLLGRLLEFVETLSEAERELAQPRTVPDFCAAVRKLATSLLAVSDDDTWSLAPILDALLAMASRAELVGLEEPVSTLSLARLLEAELGALASTDNFLSGGITFCELLPQRTIPFRTIAVLGLNQADFPRSDPSSTLDRMAASPMRGDRTLRADDRYLFLELIVAAEEHLLLSYVGRSIQDNSTRPPSVVVLELMQVLEQMVDQRVQAVPFPVCAHPLEPYSERYFLPGAALNSYSEVHYRAAMARRRGFQERSLRGSELVPSEVGLEGGSTVRLSDVEALFKNPSRAFLRQLGVDLEDEVRDLEDREPVSLSGLEKYSVGTAALRAVMGGTALDFVRETGQGAFPSGVPGQVFQARIEADVAALQAIIQDLTLDVPSEDLLICLELDEVRPQGLGKVRLEGRVSDVFGSRHVLVAYGVPDARRKWSLWLRHLCLLASGRQVRSFLVGREKGRPKVCILGQFSETLARGWLAAILRYYQDGQMGPLRFDLNAAFRIGTLLLGEQRQGRAPLRDQLAAEVSKILVPRGMFGRVRPDPSLTYLWGEDDPLGLAEAASIEQSETEPQFLQLVRQVILPLLESLDETLELSEEAL